MNRLRNSTSTYLRGHADQPVHWWPYGSAAFAEALRRDVPVMVSIGYSACHWCHVMSAESFSDPETAAYLNEHFVCIKVDRLEQPHVDAAYISVVQAMTGRAGWPLTAFTDAEGLAFYAGMYYPKEPRGGQPSLRQVCDAVLDAWRERRQQALSSGRMVVSMLSQDFSRASHAGAQGPTPESLAHALLRDDDVELGGSGSDAKFPELYLLQAQLAAWRALGAAGSESTVSALVPSLAQELSSAIQRRVRAVGANALSDPVAGGIFRYTVDRTWATPHYEKMLSDNAAWVETLALLQRAGSHGVTVGDVAEAARGMQRSLARSAALEEGFFTARSADSQPAPDVLEQGYSEREGSYYVWNLPLVTAALNQPTETVRATLAAHGVLCAESEPEPLMRSRGIAPQVLPHPLPSVLREPLAAAAAQRPAPEPDHLLTLETQAAAWAALAEAVALGALPEITADALAAGFQRCLGQWRQESGRFAHAIFDGKPSTVAATLADLGALGWADWRIAQATGSAPVWLDGIAQALRSAAVEGALAEFPWDASQGPLPAGTPLATTVTESAAPSAVAWGVRALRAHVLQSAANDAAAAREAAEASARILQHTLEQQAALLHAAPDAAPALAAAWMQERERQAHGVRVVHVTAGKGANELARAALAADDANLVLVRDSATYPGGATALAYVCTELDGTGWCAAPVANAAALADLLRG